MKILSIKKIQAHLETCYQQRFGVQDLSVSQAAIEQWFTTPLGQQILAAESDLLDQLLPEMYGYHLMQLSVLKNYELGRQSPITHHFSLSPTFPEIEVEDKDQETASHKTEKKEGAVACFEQLPIETESIDAAILHHVLEYSTNPHQLLRDAARSIIPNGYLVLIGFNPISSFQVRKKMGRYASKELQWRYHRLYRSRIIDWLQVLDFDVVFKQNGYFGLPFNRGYRPRLDQALAKVLPFSGAFYIIVARKSKIPLMMVKQPWKKSRGLPNWAKNPIGSRGHASQNHRANTKK